jgi:DNA-binding MurR/RpiR family transcriptional regulator
MALENGYGDVLTTIKNSMKELSKSELTVAEYLLENPYNISLLSISDLANSAGVSETTVVRFTKKLKFKGFMDFKRSFLEDMLTRPSEAVLPVYEELSLSDRPAAVMSKLFALHKRTLESTLQSVDKEILTKAATKIANAQCVEIYGNGGSGYIAQSTLFQFLRSGIRCSAWVDETTQESSTRLLGEKDVVVAISHTGQTETIIRAVQAARARGVTTIAITNYPDHPLAKECDLPLITAVTETPIGAEAGASRVAQLAVLDTLVVSVALLRKQSTDIF